MIQIALSESTNDSITNGDERQVCWLWLCAFRDLQAAKGFCWKIFPVPYPASISVPRPPPAHPFCVKHFPNTIRARVRYRLTSQEGSREGL